MGRVKPPVAQRAGGISREIIEVAIGVGGIGNLGGKIMVSEGGQNPLEAARLDCAIVFGKQIDNYREITTILTKKKEI